MTHSCKNILTPRATNTAWDRSFPFSHPQCRSSPIFSSHKYTPTIFPSAKYTLPIFLLLQLSSHHSSIYFINIPHCLVHTYVTFAHLKDCKSPHNLVCQIAPSQVLGTEQLKQNICSMGHHFRAKIIAPPSCQPHTAKNLSYHLFISFQLQICLPPPLLGKFPTYSRFSARQVACKIGWEP